MKCPGCAYPESKVIDSRPTVEGNSIRRRRECLACQKRFTTFETIETSPIIVIKKNGGTFTFHSHALEKEMATRSSVLAQGRWRLMGCRLWDHAELDTTEAT